MILKDKVQTSSVSIKLDAGIKQEQDVAFYLRRAYKDRDNVMVFNDIRLSHGGESAQIDHLIVIATALLWWNPRAFVAKCRSTNTVNGAAVLKGSGAAYRHRLNKPSYS